VNDGASSNAYAVLSPGVQTFGKVSVYNAEEDNPERRNSTGDGKENQSQNSYGTISMGTFNSKLGGAPGIKICTYVSSNEFGKFGESNLLIDNINVSFCI
jgi:hypothetical protein